MARRRSIRPYLAWYILRRKKSREVIQPPTLRRQVFGIGPEAGGYVTSINMTADGSRMVTSTDVGNGYWTDTSDDNWKFIVNRQNFPGLDAMFAGPQPDVSDSMGTYAAAIAPSNKNVSYFHFGGRFFRTTDNFATVHKTENFTCPGFANGTWRLCNDRLVVDPINPNVVMLGSQGAGAYYSLDGGVTLTKVSGPPDLVSIGGKRPKPILLAVDPSSGGSSFKNRWYMYVPDDGIWVSNSGPAGPWNKIDAPPEVYNGMTSFMYVHTNGDMWVSPHGRNELWKRSAAGVWTIETDFEAQAFTILGNGQKVALHVYGNMRWTTLGEEGWRSMTQRPHYPPPPEGGFFYRTTKIKYLDHDQYGLIAGKAIADPNQPDKFWVCHGVGVCSATLPPEMYTDDCAVVFNDFSHGNRMLIGTKTRFQPDGVLLRTAWDKGPFIDTTIEEQRNPTRANLELGVEHQWDIGWVPNDYDAIYALIRWSNNHSGMSLDRGKTWRKFAEHPSGYSRGGCLQFTSRDRGFWLPANNGYACHTFDGGRSWEPLIFTAKDGSVLGTENGETGWSFAYYFNKQNLLASHNEPGVVYAYNYGPDRLQQVTGFWRKEANSDTFEQVFVGAPTPSRLWLYYYMAIHEIPGHAGNLIMTTGDLSKQGQAHMVRSSDRGNTWNKLTTTLDGVTVTPANVTALGFGKAASGSSYPAIRFFGQINNQFAIWETLDNFATTTFAEGYPLETVETVSSMSGDPNIFGRWIYSIGSTGWVESNLQG